MDSTSPEPDTKRRKLRKGTTSCWDCKKRKVKCTFDAKSDMVCIACRRRGAPCIGQDHPEEEFQAHTEGNNRDSLFDRLQRVEALLERLVERDRLPPPIQSGYPFTPATSYDPSLDTSSTPILELCVAVPVPDESRKLSEKLLMAFPSQRDVDVFCKSDYITTFYCHQIFTKSVTRPEHEALHFVNEIAKIPDPTTTPPILVAKRMILFALLLQYFRTQHARGLTEHPAVIMDRLVETAVRFVTTNENMVCCIEGLECIILEGIFQSNGGNLRRAWLAFRRAITIAQFMKIDLLNPPPIKALDLTTKVNLKSLWFRIVYMDSHLSLMLGLSHSGQEINIEHDVPGETPSNKLERAHTLSARRIIDRNRRNSFFQDFSITQELDRELLSVAKALPDKFWVPPNFTTLQINTPEALWEILRLSKQLHHYNLVHLLHLPYLLCSDKEPNYYIYSRIACVNASREILTRVIAFRNFTRNILTIYCRTADFFALMAGMTILLTHIDSHQYKVEDWRAHQRLSDRAMVERLLETLDNVEKLTDDNLTRKSAEQLRCLLDIERDTARGVGYCAQSTVRSLEEHSGELRLSIPYFGIIKIGREGITKNNPVEANSLQALTPVAPNSVHVTDPLISATGFNESHALQQASSPSSFLSIPDVQPVTASQMPLASINPDNGLNQQQLQYPGLAASVNDWAFQGVDAAFFDSVVRGTVDWDQALQENGC